MRGENTMNNRIIKGISILCVSALAFATVGFSAAGKPKLNKSKKSVAVGSKFTLKVSNTSKKIKWSSSNTKVVSISSTSKKSATFKAKKKGNATITAKVGNKSLKCKVTVKKKSSGGGITVYVANTGTKYHTSNCRFVSRSKNAVSLTWAKQNGYEPCSFCKP